MNGSARAVLFVDVTGSTRLYEELGDEAAHDRIDLGLRSIERATEAQRGRVVKHLGDGLMCAFADPDAAVRASHEMHTAVAEQYRESTVGIHVGCHYGPVIESAGDLYGDCVNVAARVAAMAKSGQIILTREVVDHLDDRLRQDVRRLGHAAVKGRREQVEIFEYVWETAGGLTVIRQTAATGTVSRLRLVSDRGEQCFDGAGSGTITLGRDASSDVVVADAAASRRHAHVERRGGKFVLVDHSANGTYVAIVGESEWCLRREELVLRGRGRISLGRPTTDDGSRVLEFRCE